PASIDAERGDKRAVRGRRQRDPEGVGVAAELQLWPAEQVDALDHRAGQRIASERLDRALRLRPIEEDRVERFAFAREADVFGRGRLQLVFREHTRRRRLGRAFAELAPWAGGENRFAVALRPRSDLLDDRLFLLVDGAV